MIIALIGATACGGSTSGKLAERGDQRLARGEPLAALANYDRALAALSSSADGDALRARRDYAAAGLVRMELADARDAFAQKKYDAAFEKLWALHKTNVWGALDLDEQVVKAMADAVAELWSEVDAFALDHHYDLAVVRAEYLVEPFPAGHSHRLRFEALLDEAHSFHTERVDDHHALPGAAVFHYAMARRFGGLRSPVGEQALRTYAAITGTSADALAQFRHAATAGSDAAAEHYLMVAYKVDGVMPDDGAEWFGLRYGLGPEELTIIMAGDVPPTPHDRPAALALPDPDLIDIASDRTTWFRDRGFAQTALLGPAVEITARLRGSPLEDSDRGHGMAFAFRMGKELGAELRFEFESFDIGGHSSGWGLEYRSLKRDSGLLWGYGFGYATQRSRETGHRHTSVHVPVFVGLPLTTWLVTRFELDLNLLQLDGTGTPGVENQHFSPLTLTAEIPIYKRYFGRAMASYHYGAGDELVFGGSIGWRYGDD
jgi:hypothetical protein